jgi:hypothetical protein
MSSNYRNISGNIDMPMRIVYSIINHGGKNMSDLTAANCGCSNNSGNSGLFGGNNSCLWLIILLFACGGNNGCGCGNSGLFNNSGDNGSCCEWIIWLLLLSTFCGNNSCCG